jgi:hypothetical protein
MAETYGRAAYLHKIKLVSGSVVAIPERSMAKTQLWIRLLLFAGERKVLRTRNLLLDKDMC